MEFELWWLLAIPLFFSLGWVASRIDTRQAVRQSSQMPDAYFRGLNFLLNEQPDKAIDAFVEVMKVDPETVELHFALGNLFRRRGETDRAIRVHQSLVTRDDLPAAQREHALYELGQDFLRAGLLDRAEDAFVRLESGAYATAALRHRLEIAQMVRDWPRAIDLAQRLRQTDGTDPGTLLAHLHCEVALAADDCEAAIEAWSTLARERPAHLGLIAERWLQAHERLGRLSEGLTSLEAMLGEQPPVDALRALAQARARHDGNAAAIAWLRGMLARHPSLLGLEQLLELRKAADPAADDAADIALSAALIQRQAARLGRFVCGHCGFKARRHYWQCPGCSRWDTYAPRRTEELNTDTAA
jgi:lipopolysaccharide biosynthesis regulator YciM